MQFGSENWGWWRHRQAGLCHLAGHQVFRGHRMCEKRTFTRQELYELVWKTPMRRLARQFGLSDVGLAKTCQRHSIPKPPPGYWAKKAHGKIVRRRSLLPCDDPALATITICRRSTTGNSEERAKPPSLGSTFFDQELGRLAELEAGGKDPIVVAESLRSRHAWSNACPGSCAVNSTCWMTSSFSPCGTR